MYKLRIICIKEIKEKSHCGMFFTLDYPLKYIIKIHSEQINMAVFFWYLVKSDMCRRVHWTSHYLQGPEKQGHV